MLHLKLITVVGWHQILISLIAVTVCAVVSVFYNGSGTLNILPHGTP